ncbi:MAG: hypothetical protein IJG59_00855 [Erysipelotrichaceae bacterium]|nr:hypothetical protein [Erysipelotrichaceae bacterium]
MTINRPVKLFDKVRIIDTDEVGFVVDISDNGLLIIERLEENCDSDFASDRLITDVFISDVEVI